MNILYYNNYNITYVSPHSCKYAIIILAIIKTVDYVMYAYVFLKLFKLLWQLVDSLCVCVSVATMFRMVQRLCYILVHSCLQLFVLLHASVLNT